MTAVVLGAIVLLLLGATGLALAAALRLRTIPELLLAAYVSAFAEVVGLVLVLSAFGAVRRAALLIALAGLCAVAVGAWWQRGRPLPPVPDAGWRSTIFLRRSSAIALFALAVAAALAYVVALIVGTPPNNWDSLTYHLARAALWRQEGGLSYLPDAYDERLNANPPNAELALTFVLEMTRDERSAGFVQFFALIACGVGVVALSRKVGLARREANFGALLFIVLPIVLLQASTTQNDLVVASMLMAATVFVSGSSRPELGLASLATALAIGTKITAAFGLPVLCAVALIVPPKTSRAGRVAGLALGAAAGSYWYLVNVLETGRVLGRRPDTELVAVLDLQENFLAAYARALDAFELPGAEGADILLYVVAAAAVVACLAIGALHRRLGFGAALVTGALIVAPLAIWPVSYLLWRVFAKLHHVLQEPAGLFPVGEWSLQTTASESFSWFGPLGPFLVIGIGAAVVVLGRRRSLPPLAFVLAAAPLVWLVLMSLTIGYDPWQGRFFVFPIALSASLWGLLLRIPTVAWAAAAIGVTTAALTFVHSYEKPSGLRLFEGRARTSVWGMKRWQAQSLHRPEMGPVLRSLDELVPRNAALALALGVDDFGYPAFGPHLERHVELVPVGSGGRTLSATDWLLANQERASEIDRACWELVLTPQEGWKLFRRAVSGCPP